MAAIPLPNLTLAAPSTATSSGAFSPSFVVGTGASGGLPIYAIYAGLAIVAFYVIKKARK